MPILLRLPLLQLGPDLVFDCELSAGRGGVREITERRIAAGDKVGDHSRRGTRTWVVEGAVSQIAQPQNLLRPNARRLEIATTALLTVAQSVVPVSLAASRIGDFERRLDRLLDDEEFGQIEMISKVVGRRKVVLERWEAMTRAEDGAAVTYRLTLREVRTFGVQLGSPSEVALALNGSGQGAPGGGGPSQATPLGLDVVP